jgi:hypothetical protein
LELAEAIKPEISGNESTAIQENKMEAEVVQEPEVQVRQPEDQLKEYRNQASRFSNLASGTTNMT